MEQKQRISLNPFINGIVWLLLLTLALGVPIFAFYLYPQTPFYVQYPATIVAWLLAVAGAFFITNESFLMQSMLQGAWFELQKTVWPKRSEVIQTAWMVILFVGLVAFFLWLADLLFSWSVGLILGMGS